MPGVDVLLDESFFLGAGVASDTPFYLPVSIGAKSYLIDLKKYARQTIQQIRPPSDNSFEPGEQSLTQEGLWRRSQQNWVNGAGREYFDDVEAGESSYAARFRLRFYASKGVDIWTPKRLTLLKDTELKRASANTNLKVLQVGTRLYIADGSTILFTADATPASPTFTDSTAGGTTVQSITTDGNKVWAVITAGIRETLAGSTTASTLAAGTFTLVGYANARLIAANANVLYEVSRAGVLATISTHANTAFTWKTIAAAPNAIYVGGTCVDRSEIYALTALDATGALSPPVLATTLPDGETINAILYYGGAVILGTSRGIRVATIGSNNSLQYGPVILVPNGVNALEGQGEFVWFTWTAYDGTSTGLGRVNLAAFTDTLVPAYATDLMYGSQAAVLSVCTVSSRRYFAVSGVGFVGENANFVASGSVDSGFIRYGTVEKKISAAIDLRHDALPAGAIVAVSVQTDEGVLTAIGNNTLTGSLSPVSPLGIEVARTEAVKVIITLTRATVATLAPTLRRWTLYSIPTPVLSDTIILPLIIKSKIKTENGEGAEVFYSPLEEYQYLQNLANTKAIQRYVEGNASYNVYVSSVKVEPQDWTADKSYFDGIIYVQLTTIGVI